MLELVQLTAVRKLWREPEIVGIVSIFHADPFQVSAKVCSGEL